MSMSTIRYDLYEKLKNFADTHSLDVAWEGVEAKKPSASEWLEVFILPAPTINSTLNGYRSTWRGIFQVNIWSKSGKGVKAAETIADSLVSTFPIVPKSGYVSIEQTPSINSKIIDPSGWTITPVTMPYRYESTNVYYDGSSYTDAWAEFTSTVNSRIDSVENALSSGVVDWAAYTPIIYADGLPLGASYTHTASHTTVFGVTMLVVEIAFSSVGTASGAVSISLPNTPASASSVTLSNVRNIVDTGFAGTSPFAGRVDSGVNRVFLERLSGGGNIPVTKDDLTGSTTITFTALYKA